MTLRDDVESAKTHVGPQCGVVRVLSELGEPFRSEVAEAIADPTVQATALSKVLRDKHDIDISDFTISRHRNGRCRCR